MPRTRAAMLLAAAILAFLRFFQPAAGLSWPEIYQAIAHLFVGGLVVAAWRSGDRWQWGTLAALTLVETVAATVGLLR